MKTRTTPHCPHCARTHCSCAEAGPICFDTGMDARICPCDWCSKTAALIFAGSPPADESAGRSVPKRPLGALTDAEILQMQQEDRSRMAVIAWMLGAWFVIAASVGAWLIA